MRFIPTCVGNTSPADARPSAASVHPHVRGEHGSGGNRPRCGSGSSPRAWGTQDRLDHVVGVRRFIPTCVGNTRCRASRRRWPPVHPHVRGEHSLSSRFTSASTGSSPRAWGTHDQVDVILRMSRFIPTCVGNTATARKSIATWPVHPHVRGEHWPETRFGIAQAGSSPRAWGTRTPERRPHWQRRFIPTCVGNTPSNSGRNS